MKPGDTAKLIGIPPNVRDDDELQTRTLFEKCMGREWNPMPIGVFQSEQVSVSEDLFEVYEIASNLFAFCETRHYENTTVSLIIGPEKAALIDTGSGTCGRQ